MSTSHTPRPCGAEQQSGLASGADDELRHAGDALGIAARAATAALGAVSRGPLLVGRPRPRSAPRPVGQPA